MKTQTIILAAVATLFLIGVMTAARAIDPVQVSPVQDAQNRFLQTFRLVQAANVGGATNDELSSPVQKLNEALRLIESANQLQGQGQTVAASNAAAHAVQILNAVQSDSAALQTRAANRAQVQVYTAYAFAPILAFLTTLGYHFGGRAYRRYRATRIMNMRVRVNPDAGKKK